MLSSNYKKISDCTKKLHQNPQDVKAYHQRACQWLKMEKYHKAISDLTLAIELRKNDERLYYHRGIAHIGLKNYQKAISDWSKAIQINRKYALAYHNRGQAHAILQNYLEAIADFSHAVKINPKYTLAYRNRALVYHVLEKYEQALKDYDSVIRLEPNDSLAYFNRGIIIRILEKQGKRVEIDYDNILIQQTFKNIYNNIYKSIKRNKFLLRNSGVIAGSVIFVLLVPLVNLVISSNSQEYASFPEEKETRSLSNKQSNLPQQKNTFKQVEGVPSGLFNYGGSTTWAPIRKEVDSIIQENQQQFKLRYQDHPIKNPGSGVGISMLLDSQLSVSQSSRPLKPEEYQEAKERQINLKQIPVAIDGITIAVNPNLNIAGLSVVQLKNIYLGKITNWKEVGGPDIEIVAFSKSPHSSGTAEFFVNQVMDKEHIGSNVQLVSTTTMALREVAANEGAIFFASAPEVVGQCQIKTLPIGHSTGKLISPHQQPYVTPSQCPQKRNQIDRQVFQNGDYPLTRQLFVIVKEDGGRDERAGKAYANLLLSKEGQRLIEKAGFISIYPSAN